MNVANLELCRELHGLSGWYDAYRHYWNGTVDEPLNEQAFEYGKSYEACTPAYDLGYLLRKLPEITLWRAGDSWHVMPYYQTETTPEKVADSPEDAACKLCIELFKSGVLSRED